MLDTPAGNEEAGALRQLGLADGFKGRMLKREKGPFGDPIWLGSGDDSDVQISFGRLGMAVGDSKLISLAPLFRCAAAKLSRLNLGG